MKKEFAPVTSGEMLKEEFLAEYGLSQNQLAKAIGISPNRIAGIVHNRRRITADTALRLGLYFGNSPEFWLNLQTHYDLKMARKNLKPEAVRRMKAGRAACSALILQGDGPREPLWLARRIVYVPVAYGIATVVGEKASP